MSIEIMQEFVYETDDLELVDMMLRAACHAAFDDKPPGQYSALHVQTKKRGGSFDNGIKYNFERQPKIMPLPQYGGYGLVVPERIHGATVLKIIDTKTNLELAAAAACEYHREHNPQHPTRLWITTLADYKSDAAKDDPVFSTINEMCNHAMTIINDAKEAHGEEFLQACGSGYNSFFNDNDGDVGIGYRIQHRPSGGWNNLDVSLVHVYYGK